MKWFNLFRFSWLRRCRTCGIRGSNCLCRHPSLALEHIFFLEERKNKFGARNFSHVSDTMMTTTSPMFASSSAGTATNCSTSTSTATNSSTSASTIVMRGAGSSVDDEVNPTDYYYQTTVSDPLPYTTSDGNCELLTPRTDQKTMKHLRTGRFNSSTGSAADDAPSTTLVRKQSARLISKARHDGYKNMRPPLTEIVMDGYILYPEETNPVSLLPRAQPRPTMPHIRRQTQGTSNNSVRMTNIRPLRKKEPGVSFQFYGRGGAAPPPVPSLSSDRSLSVSSCSTNDSFMIGPHSISSTRVSQFSDRVSLETNLGSFNPQSTLTSAGRYLDSGLTSSIHENEEAQALEVLNGWLHASSVSTQDSFMLSR